MDQDKIEVYHYIVGSVPEDDVLVCDMETSFFPAMPTARKLVSIGPTFSNPYLDFDQRESDRKEMLAYLKTGHPSAAVQLLRDYRVRYFLSVNQDWSGSSGPGLELESVFRNREYTLFRLNY
jgi:hypothetical protein